MINYLLMCCLVEPLLILNRANEPVLPHQFRTCHSPYTSTVQPLPTRKGLKDLHLSGSGQFSEKGWEAIEKALDHPPVLYDLDLRQESHGFLNGAAVSWYVTRDWVNKGKTDQEVFQAEKELLSHLAESRTATVAKVLSKTPQSAVKEAESLSFPVHEVQNEESMITSHHAHYQRIPLVDHMALTDEEIKALLAFHASLPKDAWVHVHCAGGDGRTTSVMVFFDILKNGQNVSFEEIIARQHLIGGIDLSHFGSPDEWKYPYAKARYEKLQQFYMALKR